jgi:hypothetical protein
LGFAGLAAGGVAVFVTHLEADPVGLMAVGLIFMIIALGECCPGGSRSARTKPHGEVERQAVETFVERVAQVTPAANQHEFLGALSDLAEDAPRVADPVFSAFAYERLVVSILDDAIDTLSEDPKLPLPLRRVELDEFGIRPDAVISTTDGRTLIVELEVSQKISARDILAQLQRFRDQTPGLSGVLLISRYSFRASDLLAHEPYFYYIVVAGREDQNELTRVIRRAFEDLAKARSDGSKALAMIHRS